MGEEARERREQCDRDHTATPIRTPVAILTRPANVA